ncbi:MAG: T9SS type A sorting domain-containing protein, partial [Chitinophagales bacterium]
FLLTKINKFGTCTMAIQCGGMNEDGALDIEIDPTGGLLICGYFSTTMNILGTEIYSAGYSDAFVASISFDGILNWVKVCGGTTGDNFGSVAADKDGNVYVSGTISSTVNFAGSTFPGYGEAVATAARYNSTGTEIWMRKSINVSVSAYSFGTEVEVDKNQNVYMGGIYYGDINIGPFELFDGNPHMFFTKLSNVGVPVWAVDENGFYGAFAWSMDADKNGNLYIAGQFQYEMTFGGFTISTGGFNTNAYVAKIRNVDGSVLWINQVECADNSFFHDIQVVSRDLLLVCGGYETSASYDDLILYNGDVEVDGMIVKIDPATGAGLQTFSMGSDAFTTPQEIGYDKLGNILLTGGFKESMTLGETFTVTSYGGYDCFYTKITGLLPREMEEEDLTTEEPSGFTIFPNPAVDIITVNYNIAENASTFLEIANATGEIVNTESKELIPGINSISININELPAGIYFVKINDHAEQFVKIK